MQAADETASHTAYATARTLEAFWTRPGTLDGDTRRLCGELAEAVDPAGALAAAAREDPDGITTRIAVVVDAACERDPRVLSILERLIKRRLPRPPGPDKTVPPGLRPAERGLIAGDILLAASDPTDLARLRLGHEEREIREALDLSAGRGRWSLHPWPALRLRDLTRALLDLQPRIVHFAGHGSKKGGLFLENEAGLAQRMPAEALADLFGVVEGAVSCVVLNACYSEAQARAISAYVPFVVGSPSAIADDAAIAFSVGFYQALGAGRDVPQAHRVGCIHMRGTGTSRHPLPVLIQRS
jgi:hypothetical protein